MACKEFAHDAWYTCAHSLGAKAAGLEKSPVVSDVQRQTTICDSRWFLNLVETSVEARVYDGECSGKPRGTCSSTLELSIVRIGDWNVP